MKLESYKLQGVKTAQDWLDEQERLEVHQAQIKAHKQREAIHGFIACVIAIIGFSITVYLLMG